MSDNAEVFRRVLSFKPCPYDGGDLVQRDEKRCGFRVHCPRGEVFVDDITLHRGLSNPEWLVSTIRRLEVEQYPESSEEAFLDSIELYCLGHL